MIACSRLLERRAKESAKGRKRGGSGGENKKNVKLFIFTGFDYSREFTSSRGCPYIASMSRTPKGSSGLGFQPSKSCGFCQKNLTSLGTNVPRVSLFNAVRNKKFINATLLSDETLVLTDVVSSLSRVFASF